MEAALSIAVAVLLFVGLAIFFARRGLHRSLETMPPLAGERTLLELQELSLVFFNGGGHSSLTTYPGCIARVTSARLLVAQRVLGGSGKNRLLSVLLSPTAVEAMRAVDAEAIDRALKSFSIGRAVPGSLASTADGGLALSLEYLGPALTPPSPPRWEFPAGAAAQLAPVLREAGLC